MGRTIYFLALVCAVVSGVVQMVGCAHHPETASPTASSPEETRILLMGGDFKELERRFGAIQAEYDRGEISDEELRAAFRAFYPTDSRVEPQYSAWVRHSPRSYVAHLARGIYYKQLGQERRGQDLPSDSQIREMEAAFAIAGPELEASIKLESKPLLSYLHEVDLRMYAGDHEGARRLLESSVAIDPGNFIVREKYMGTLRTAWGGSTQEMKVFLGECRKAGLSHAHIQALAAQVFEDEMWIRLYQEWDPLLEAAKASNDANDYAGAVGLYSKYLVSHPQAADVLRWRSAAELQLGQTQPALVDLERAAELGDADSQYSMGAMYLTGTNVPRNPAKGTEWLKKAADQDYPAALNLLDRLSSQPQRGDQKPGT